MDNAIYVQWSDDGQHVRKWSHEPFEGSAAFVDADELTDLRAEVERLRRTLGTINAVIGNADHSKGHGPNAAELRGNMLNDIRECARAALTQTKDTTDDA